MFTDAADEVAFAGLLQRRLTVTAQRDNTLFIRLRLYYRFARLGLHLVEGAVLAVLCGAAFVQYQPWQQPVIRWWHRRFCNILGLEIRVQGAPLVGRAMWVSNHVSWLDIPVIGTHFPVYFLSKAEVAKWPVVGWLARVAGTLFIQRGSGDAGNVGQQLAGHLRDGRNVLFFPEGTTTDGHRLKRFFHKLFTAAVEAQVPVQPVLLCYRDEHDALHPHAPFIGDDEFLSHAIDILKGDGMVVDLLVLPPEPVGEHDARSLAKALEVRMGLALAELQQRKT
ncbi:MAG: lysophospholipid acyltransferase family protein [Moraxellaceae bacterium]|nr:lysophospholipid acyltransferase family protein [Moraxellaceae bacterium]